VVEPGMDVGFGEKGGHLGDESFTGFFLCGKRREKRQRISLI